ncbi:hypothetical protein FX984_01757 [Pseudomonas marginalis]|nr:hypothetical protein FX984_01757 [Pseudomonas marginalis]
MRVTRLFTQPERLVLWSFCLMKIMRQISGESITVMAI